MFHGACALSDHSLVKMISSLSVKNKRKNYSSGDVDKSITKIETGDISQARAVRKYGITHQKLAWKCNKNIENVEEKRPGYLTVIGEASEKYLVQWTLEMQKQGLPVGRWMINQKDYEIYRYMFGSM